MKNVMKKCFSILLIVMFVAAAYILRETNIVASIAILLISLYIIWSEYLERR